MQPKKGWLVLLLLFTTWSSCLLAQSDSDCFACVVEKNSPPASHLKRAKTPPPPEPASAAASSAAPAPAPAAPSNGEIQALHDLVAAQQEQLDAQRRQLDQLKAQMEQLLEANHAATAASEKVATSANLAQQSAAAANDKVQALGGSIAELKAQTASAADALQSAGKTAGELAHPTAIHYKGITITPGGFVTADSVVRSRNENADVTSNFGAAPLDGVANSNLSEFRFSARATRLTLLTEGAAGNTKLTGYYEVDFLGQAPTANQVQTNSFTPRQRQLWAQAAFANGLTLTAGQYWSLITTDRKGIAVRAEFIPNTIEGSYVVGYNYVRQTAFRITDNFNDRFWAAFEVANPETNQPNASFVPPNLFGFNNSPNAGSPNGNTLNFLAGSANGFSTNLAPDLLAKAVWEPGWGHYEFKALGRFFRDRIGGNTNHAYGGGLGFAAVLPVVAKKADYLIEGFGGNGIGRYGAANGSDITLRPDGMIVPVHAIHVMTGLEVHPRPKLDWFLYGGDEYYRRAAYVNPTDPTKPAGYGSPLVVNTNCDVEVVPTGGAACGAQNKDVWQITSGLWYRAYKGPFGTLQYGAQYEYLHRSNWSGVGGAPQGSDGIVLSSFRYLLP
jgi:uncharacterized coiled-coil protein SlyX